MESSAPGRLTHIDAIRAIAALLVIVMHCCAGALPANPSWLAWLADISDFGRLGVVLFFLVSGFVIPGSLKDGQHPATFWVRRVFRLYPVYWLSILLVLLVQWQLLRHSFNTSQIVANLTMLQNFLGYENLEGVYWTLKLELCFYFFCYALFLLRLLERTLLLEILSVSLALLFLCYLDYWSGPLGIARRLLQGIAIAGDHQATSGMDHRPFPSFINMNWGYFCAYFSVMFLGAVLRKAYDRRLTTPQHVLLLALLIFWTVILPVLGILAYHRHADIGLIAIYAPFPTAVLLFLILTFRIPIRTKSMAVLGLVSYSMYLVHPIVIDMTLSLGAKIGWHGERHVAPLTLVSILVTLAASLVCYHLVELPGIAYGQRLVARLRRPEVGSAGPA